MKVLWIINGIFPEVESVLTKKTYEIKASGGWLPVLADLLSNEEDITLSVACFSSLVKELKVLILNKKTFYVIPLMNSLKQYDKNRETYFQEIKQNFNPDVIHVHGTEYTHGLTYVNACGTKNVVISIQGMPSVIADYLYSGITKREVRNSMSFKDFIRGNLIQYQRYVRKHTKVAEIELLQKVNYVIGRTSWDKAHTWAINQNLRYFHCNETLRNEFYQGVWTYDNCEKHSIFLSQAGRALKGAHQLIKALPLILRLYPDTHIYIAGDDITKYFTLKDKLRISGYGNYLRKLIKRYGLSSHISFVGAQNAEGMKKLYLNSNVFVSPSSIENSPNSLCEAQILGVPCIGSYVGGTMDLVPDFRCGKLYRFDDIEMLAKCVCDYFEESSTFDNSYQRSVAIDRHNPITNLNRQVDIYKEIID